MATSLIFMIMLWAVKQQIISVAAVMASKFVAKAMDDQENDALIEQTLNEMGENTWLS